MFKQKVHNFIISRANAYSLLILVILLLAQILTPYFYFFELFTHFSFHGAVIILFLSLLISNKISKILLFICSLVFVLFSLIYPFSYWQKDNNLSAIKIISYNLNIDNPQQNQEIKELLKLEADILGLIEVGGNSWKLSLEQLKKNYPNSCGFDENSPFGMFLFSKIKLNNCETKFIEDYFPYIQAELTSGTLIFLIHPPAPVSKELAEARIIYFAKLAELLAKTNNNFIVMGDFNNTIYSPIYRDFLTKSKSKDLMPSFIPSWRPFYLPIDRVVSKGIKATIKPLKFRYSDHRGLLINF